MAVKVPTREDVHGWLAEYDGQLRVTKKLETYLLKRMEDAGFENLDIRDSTVVDLILDDLESYA